MKRWILLSLFLALPYDAAAHLELTQPLSRYGGRVLKEAPCGMTGGQRSPNVFTFMAGQTIEIRWNEYVDHPGHYRISFDEDGDDDFVDPPCLAGCNTTTPTVEFFSNEAVLMDNIQDNAGGDYSLTVTLPNVACDNCTLQVLQVMYDKPPYTLPGNEMYYQCVDLVLLAAPAQDAGVTDVGRLDLGVVDTGILDTGPADISVMTPEKSGCVCVGPSISSPTAILLLWALFFIVELKSRHRILNSPKA